MNLTKSQIELLDLIAEGHNNNSISILLGIKVNTVKVRLRTLFFKFKVGNRGRLVWKYNQIKSLLSQINRIIEEA